MNQAALFTAMDKMTDNEILEDVTHMLMLRYCQRALLKSSLKNVKVEKIKKKTIRELFDAIIKINYLKYETYIEKFDRKVR